MISVAIVNQMNPLNSTTDPDTNQKETIQELGSENITQAIYKRNKELLEERRHAEDLLYNISEGVLAVGKDYKVVLFNHTLETMLGIPESEAIGKDLNDILKLQTQKNEAIDIIKYCFQDEGKDEGISDALLIGKSKSYFVNVKFSILAAEKDKEALECLITISDITKEILLDKAKDDFLSLASHELRTPMTVIKSYLWMLMNNESEKLSEKQIDYLSKTVNSTNDLINLINDMLNISRMEQGKITFEVKVAALVELINQAIEGLDLKAKEKNLYLKVNFEGIDTNTQVNVDVTKFKEVIINLVGNAIKFTKDGGVTVNITQEEDSIKVTIVDTGSGLAQEDSKKLFQKFGRAESSYTRVAESGGTGLGLYIVKLYTEAMGGSVGVFSEGPMKGSTFWIKLPKYNSGDTIKTLTGASILEGK